MDLWEWGRKILMGLPAELSHDLAAEILKLFGPRIPLNPAFSHLPTEVWGQSFRNPIGLAAGFDKNAELVLAAAALGFGFVEIGTVTPLPQIGNPKPRLFREAETKSLFNRMGFNNKGAGQVSENLKRALPDIKEYAPHFKIGLSVGKNHFTPLNETHKDAVKVLRYFQNKIDYVVLNVSSPNTKGLRDLQNQNDLGVMLNAIKESLQSWNQKVPVLVKLAPEIQDQTLCEIIQFLDEKKYVDGYCLTNTLAGEFQGFSGGWSGGRLADKALKSLEAARKTTPKPLISVGGLLGEKDFLERKNKGATLFQSYTGFVYGGPLWPKKMLAALKKENLYVV